MPTPHVPFAYPEEDSDDEIRPASDAETLRRVSMFLGERVIARHHGKLPPTRTIAARLIVLQALLNPDQLELKLVRSDGILAAIARELGCSRAWLSKLGNEFSDSVGMRNSWQRWLARNAYAKRAAGVHAGTWQPTPKHERRKLREAALVRNVKNGKCLSAKSADRQKMPRQTLPT